MKIQIKNDCGIEGRTGWHKHEFSLSHSYKLYISTCFALFTCVASHIIEVNDWIPSSLKSRLMTSSSVVLVDITNRKLEETAKRRQVETGDTQSRYYWSTSNSLSTIFVTFFSQFLMKEKCGCSNIHFFSFHCYNNDDLYNLLKREGNTSEGEKRDKHMAVYTIYRQP